MSRKLDYDYIYNYFKQYGCELLEKEYKNSYTTMKFRCKCGSICETTWKRFRYTPRCKNCAKINSLKQLEKSLKKKKFTYEEVKMFVEENSRCKLLSTQYINNSTKMDFLCECGNEFSTTFAKFKDRKKRQCNECSKRMMRSRFNFTIEEVNDFVRNNSNSKLLSKSYINNSEPLNFLCECGRKFTTSFAKFKDRNKRQCNKCGIKTRVEADTFDIETVKEIIEEHNCELVSREYIRARDPLEIRCRCGEKFSTSLDVFQRGKNRCDKCSQKQSSLERKVECILADQEIHYEKQFVLEDCKYIHPLPFDFAIKDQNNELICLIEIDGIQHFKPVEYFGGEDAFRNQKMRDAIKNNYCEKNNIELIRIPYFQIDNAIEILSEHLVL